MDIQVIDQTSNRQKYIASLQQAAITISKKAVMGKLLAAAPFLGWGPLPALAGMLVEWILSKAYEGGEMLVFFKFVDFRVAHQNKEYTEAAMENYIAQQSGNKERIIEAEFKLIEAHDAFVHLNSI